MSCTCQKCGQQYTVDFIVSDSIWEEIKPKGKPEGAGLLCGRCICDNIESLKQYNCYHIKDISKNDEDPDTA